MKNVHLSTKGKSIKENPKVLTKHQTAPSQSKLFRPSGKQISLVKKPLGMKRPNLLQTMKERNKKYQKNFLNNNKNFSKTSSPIRSGNKNTYISSQISNSKNDNTNTYANITPKSTNCSETKTHQPMISSSSKIINDNVDVLSNDVFLKKILSMFVSLQPNSTQKEMLDNFSYDSLCRIKELEMKINSIVINSNLIQSSENLDLQTITNCESDARKTIYRTYFDFFFQILNEIQVLATKELKSSTLILNKIDEVNSITKITSTANIEDSQLEEKSNMIIPYGGEEINGNNSFSNFISSIGSEFYMKLMGDESSIIENTSRTFRKIPSTNKRNERLMETPIQFEKRKNFLHQSSMSVISNDNTIKMSDCDDTETINQSISNEGTSKKINLIHPSQILNLANSRAKARKISVNKGSNGNCSIF